MKIDNKKLLMSSSPHIRAEENTRGIMTDVIIALLFPLIMATYFFGWRALLLTVISVASSVIFEWGYNKVTKKENTTGDLSAAVTGFLIALCIPVSAPLFAPVVGAFFAIVIVKNMYGGLGKNILNPALSARALLYSWPALMSVWIKPNLGDKAISIFANVSRSALAPEVVAAYTPLGKMKLGFLPEVLLGGNDAVSSLADVAIGNVAGALGEVSAVVIIAAAIYLLVRRVITYHIPVSFVATVAVLTFIFPLGKNPGYLWSLYSVLSGGLLFAAVFMATDYTTSPITPLGKIYYGIGCGILTVFIRYFGAYEEGVVFAILIMNCLTGVIDKLTIPSRFGSSRKVVRRNEK